MNELIQTPLGQLPPVTISPEITAARDEALAGAALIGQIRNQQENDVAVRAGMALKSIGNQIEKARKAAKEPFIEAGRLIDRSCAAFLEEVEKEAGRISNIARDFQIQEQRRIHEEREAQQRELDRIEAARLAEVRRIAQEQAEAEQKAKVEAEAAQRKLAEAKSEEDRKAAQASLEQAGASVVAAQKQAAAQFQKVEELSQSAKLSEAKPIVAQRTAGQVVKDDWEVNVTNPYELAKFHPDCVRIEALMAPIKAALNNGISVKGVMAKKVSKVAFRAGGPKAIDV